MVERMQPKPFPEEILDETVTRALNLSVLRRLDPLIEDILIKAPHTALYQMDSENVQWGKSDMKGCLLVVKRDSASRFHIIIFRSFNPRDPGNLAEDILEIHEYDAKPPFLMYQNNDKLVRGILFKEPQICRDVCSVLNRILIAFGKTFRNLNLSPTKSELEQLDADRTSNFRDGPLISSDATSKLRSDDCFVFPDGPPHLTSTRVPKNLDNLVKQSNFAYRTPDSSIFAPLNRSRFPIPNLDPSQSKNSTNTTTISVEEVREVLKRLVENESFLKIVHSEILRVRHL